MGYERYPRGTQSGDYFNASDEPDFTRDYGSGRDYSYSSARQYQAVGAFDPNRGDRYGNREQGYGNQGYRDQGSRDYGQRDYGPREYGYGRYAQRDRSGGQDPYRGGGYSQPYRGDYSNEGPRFGNGDRGTPRGGYGDSDRGFFDRAGDEVRSWFGDEEAERRREADARRDAQYGRSAHDADYHNWRRDQTNQFDRDYHEYRQENRSKFDNEFGAWRAERQGQRGLLGKVTEHMDVVGSDGAHVGTVDKVRGDRILLTKSDSDAGGRHHSIASRWLQSVDGNVTLRKTAEEAKAHWRDEERNQALFGDKQDGSRDDGEQFRGDHNLNRSFSGTY